MRPAPSIPNIEHGKRAGVQLRLGGGPDFHTDNFRAGRSERSWSSGNLGLQDTDKFKAITAPVDDNVDESMGAVEEPPMVDLTVHQPSTALATMEDGEQAFDSAPSAPDLDQARIAELLQAACSLLNGVELVVPIRFGDRPIHSTDRN